MADHQQPGYFKLPEIVTFPFELIDEVPDRIHWDGTAMEHHGCVLNTTFTKNRKKRKRITA